MILGIVCVLLGVAIIVQAQSIRSLNRRSVQLDKAIEAVQCQTDALRGRLLSSQQDQREFAAILQQVLLHIRETRTMDSHPDLLAAVHDNTPPLHPPVRDGLSALDDDIDG